MSTENSLNICKKCQKAFKEATLKKNNGFCGRCIKTSSEIVSQVVSQKQNISQKFRQEVWLKYTGDKFFGSCYVCSMKLSVFEFACGHVISEFKGGEMSLENMRVICKSCNSKIGTQNMEEFKKERYSVKIENNSINTSRMVVLDNYRGARLAY